MAEAVALYDERAVWRGRLPDGSVVRFRPSPISGRWLCDQWTSQGVLVVAGRPVCVGVDVLSLGAVRGGLGVLDLAGPVDPEQGASLTAQGVRASWAATG